MDLGAWSGSDVSGRGAPGAAAAARTTHFRLTIGTSPASAMRNLGVLCNTSIQRMISDDGAVRASRQEMQQGSAAIYLTHQLILSITKCVTASLQSPTSEAPSFWHAVSSMASSSP